MFRTLFQRQKSTLLQVHTAIRPNKRGNGITNFPIYNILKYDYSLQYKSPPPLPSLDIQHPRPILQLRQRVKWQPGGGEVSKAWRAEATGRKPTHRLALLALPPRTRTEDAVQPPIKKAPSITTGLTIIGYSY